MLYNEINENFFNFLFDKKIILNEYEIKLIKKIIQQKSNICLFEINEKKYSLDELIKTEIKFDKSLANIFISFIYKLLNSLENEKINIEITNVERYLFSKLFDKILSINIQKKKNTNLKNKLKLVLFILVLNYFKDKKINIFINNSISLFVKNEILSYFLKRHYIQINHNICYVEEAIHNDEYMNNIIKDKLVQINFCEFKDICLEDIKNNIKKRYQQINEDKEKYIYDSLNIKEEINKLKKRKIKLYFKNNINTNEDINIIIKQIYLLCINNENNKFSIKEYINEYIIMAIDKIGINEGNEKLLSKYLMLLINNYFLELKFEFINMKIIQKILELSTSLKLNINKEILKKDYSNYFIYAGLIYKNKKEIMKKYNLYITSDNKRRKMLLSSFFINKNFFNNKMKIEINKEIKSLY